MIGTLKKFQNEAIYISDYLYDQTYRYCGIQIITFLLIALTTITG